MTKQAKPKKSVKVQAQAKRAPRPKAAAKVVRAAVGAHAVKVVAKPSATKKPLAKKTAAKKPAPRKAVPKKPVAKKSAAVVKKPAPKKPAVQQAKAKKPVVIVKKPVAKKPASKKPAPKKPAVQQAKAKKPVAIVKKPVAKKLASKKAAAKKPAVQKSVAKKPAPKKAPEKKPAAAPKAVAAAPQPVVERHAAGYYNGVLLCEKPGLIPPKSPYTDRELVNIREMLQAERRHLIEVLRDLDAVTLQGAKENGKSASPGYSIHLAEDASDNVETETALLVRREEEEALMQVNAAFERLDHGIFGACMACGCKIGMPRLKAKPEAHLCIDCKQIYDKKASRR